MTRAACCGSRYPAPVSSPNAWPRRANVRNQLAVFLVLVGKDFLYPQTEKIAVLAIERAGTWYRPTFLLPVIFTVFAAGLAAQQPTLTLDDAITLARRNNPDYLAQKNDADVADWSVREAYGGLLPGASPSTSFQYH